MPDDIHEFVNSLAAQGIRVFLEQGRLQCRGPQEALAPALLALVRSRRDEIVAHLERSGEAARPHPLTAGQQSLLLHQRLTPDSVAYNLAFAARARGAVDAGRLDSALRTVMGRHAILRTTYTWGDGESRQRAGQVPERVLVEETTTEELVESTVEAFMDRPFELERELPVRAALIRTGPTDELPVLVLVVHHIAADLWSIDVIVDEWLTVYRASTAQGGELPPPVDTGFSEQVRRESRWLTEAEAERGLSFWREQLGGELPELKLPFDRPRPSAQTFRGGRLSVGLDAGLSAALVGLARRGAPT
ncbi:condensation domain-containing protein, partial [Kitasatospora cystarginea]